MKGAYIRATVKAEIKLARRGSRAIDRPKLRRETGLRWDALESCISAMAKELAEEGR